MKKILVIEDDTSIRRILKYDLKQNGYEVYEADNGISGLEEFNNSNPDLIIVDYMMPMMNGFDFIRELRTKTQIPVIMLTAINDESTIINTFEIGVDDYITKPFSPNELMARVKRLIARTNNTIKSDTKTDLVQYNNIAIDKTKYEVFEDDVMVPMPLKEYELLLYLIENKGMVLSRDTILNNIWGFAYDGDTRIVDVHVSKLRDRFKNDFIKTKRGVGYSIE